MRSIGVVEVDPLVDDPFGFEAIRQQDDSQTQSRPSERCYLFMAKKRPSKRHLKVAEELSCGVSLYLALAAVQKLLPAPRIN